MTYYLAISSVVFALLCVIWSKDTWLNLFLKVLFIGLSIWGAVTFFAVTKFITLN